MTKKLHILGGGVVELRQDIDHTAHTNTWEHHDAPFFERRPVTVIPVVEELVVDLPHGMVSSAGPFYPTAEEGDAD
jgi:hypothetical protein